MSPSLASIRGQNRPQAVARTKKHCCLSNAGCLDYWVLLPPGMTEEQMGQGSVLFWDHGLLHGPQTCHPALERICSELNLPVIAPCTPATNCHGPVPLGPGLYHQTIRWQIELIRMLHQQGSISTIAASGISQGAGQAVSLLRVLIEEYPEVLTIGPDGPVVVPVHAPTGWIVADWRSVRVATSPWMAMWLGSDIMAGWLAGAVVAANEGSLQAFWDALSSLLRPPQEVLAAINVALSAPNLAQQLGELAAMGAPPVRVVSALDCVTGGWVFGLWAWVRDPAYVRFVIDWHSQWASGRGPAFSQTLAALARGLGREVPSSSTARPVTGLATAACAALFQAAAASWRLAGSMVWG